MRCEPAPAPPDAAGIIASADLGTEGGRRELESGHSVPSPPIRPSARPPIHIPRTDMLRRGRPKRGPDLNRTPSSGTESPPSRAPGSLQGLGSQVPALSLAYPLAIPCHHQRYCLPPLLCARPYSRLVKQPGPALCQTILTHPESEGVEDNETSKGQAS